MILDILNFVSSITFFLVSNIIKSQVGVAVIIRISHLCGPGIESWTHMWAEICRSLSDFKGFSPGTPVFLPHKNRQ